MSVMRLLGWSLLSALLLIGCALSAQAQVAGKWTPWFEVGGKLSSDSSDNGEAELFVPLMGTDRSLLYTNLEGRIFEDDLHDGNFALGYRQMTPWGFNPGIWLGYSPFRSDAGGTYHGISGGLELLSHGFDIRLNGYLPFDNDRIASQSTQQSFSQSTSLELGTNQFPVSGYTLTDLFLVTTTTDINTTSTTRESAMRGFDGEIGGLLNLTPENFELRAYVGGYYFDSDLSDDITGVKTRLELRVLDVIPGLPQSRLTLDAAYRYDDVRKSDGYIGAKLRIPLGGSDTDLYQVAELSDQERRMLDGINREDPMADAQTTTVSSGGGTTTTREETQDALTDVNFDKVALVANTTDAADVQTAINDTGANTLFIVDGGQIMNGQIALEDSQTLMGGGGDILVRGQTTGTEVTFNAPGIRPTFDYNLAAPVVTVVSNTHVADFDITGGGGRNTLVGLLNTITSDDNTGVYGSSNLTNVVVEELNISQMGFGGIIFDDNNSDLLIFGNTITDHYANGIRIRDNNQDVTIRNNNISNGRRFGVALRNDNSNIQISENTITDVGAWAIRLSNNNPNITITDNTINNVDIGIGLQNFNDFAAVLRNDITTVNTGIFLGFGNDSAQVAENTLSNISGIGINLGEANNLASIRENSIGLAGGSFAGIYLVIFHSGAELIGNTVTGDPIAKPSFGIYVNDSNTSTTLNGNIVDTAQIAFGFRLLNANLNIINNNVEGDIDIASFNFFNSGNSITLGTGNTSATPASGNICQGVTNFTGLLEVNGDTYIGPTNTGTASCAP